MAEKEYIEREATYKCCEAYFSGVCVYDVSASEVINDFENVIEAVPTADVAPVRHGHWIRPDVPNTRSYKWQCSECGQTAYWLHYGTRGNKNIICKYSYCPNCGAKMDGYNNLDINCCEYCRVNDDFKCSVIHFDGGDNGTVDVQMPFDEMEIIYRKDEKTVFHLDFEINYCPMCGRKLKTDGKENENDPR